MKENEAFYRYAKALFHIQSSTEIDTLLQGCVLLTRSSPELLPYLENPQITLRSKRNVLQTCIQNPLLVNFLMLLIAKGRLKDLPQIARQYHTMQLEKQNLMEAELITARPIDNAILDQLKSRLEKKYGKTFSVRTGVDPQLMGGAVLSIGNDFLDYSLKGRLAKLKKTLLRRVDAA